MCGFDVAHLSAGATARRFPQRFVKWDTSEPVEALLRGFLPV